MRPPIFLLLFTMIMPFACRQNAPASEGKSTAASSDTSATGRQPNPWRDAGCELITDAEVQQMFGIDPQRDTYNARALPGQGYCLRSWNKPDWKERESANEKGAKAVSPRNTLVTQVLDFGTEEMSRLQFETILKRRGDLYDEVVEGVGDAAVWSTSATMLTVKKGHLFLQLTLDWADSPHDNLPKAKELAAVALKKM